MKRSAGIRTLPPVVPPLRQSLGFTLLELVLVIAIVGLLSSLIVVRLGTFQRWQEEGFLRRFTETIQFLHHQAVVDGVFYRMDFDFEENPPVYKVGEIVAEEVNQSNLAAMSAAGADPGILSVELADFLVPSLGTFQNLIPPRSFPSLAKPIELPEGVEFSDVRTMRGVIAPGDPEKAYILFSPRGFSEFAVIHLALSHDRVRTILVNPFTGLTSIYKEYKDFEWSYGRTSK